MMEQVGSLTAQEIQLLKTTTALVEQYVSMVVVS